MSIEQQLRERLTSSMKSRDLRTANVIRMINTKLMERTKVRNFSGEVDDALCLEVIGAYRKSLQKAIEPFRQAGDRGAESIAELEFEISVCSEYLPKGLGEEELRAAVSAAIAELGATDLKMIGRIIGVVMKQHKGRVDADDVKRVASEQLQG